MEQGRARLLLSVDNLEASLAFYSQQLGWEMLELADGGGAALLRIGGVQDEVVLASQQALPSSLESWLLPNHFTPQRGSLVYVGVTSVTEMEAGLRAMGCTLMTTQEDPGHIRELHVPTIDGYIIVYWQELFPSDDEIIEMYEAGTAALLRAIEGLSEAQLSLCELLGKWSIREHVLHVVDLELVAMHKVKFALAEPGRIYQGNSFQPDEWQSGLAYAERPIENEVQLFLAARGHILGLCKHLPDALGRTIRTKDREETVAQLLKMMAGHASHHIRAMDRIREKSGLNGAPESE